MSQTNPDGEPVAERLSGEGLPGNEGMALEAGHRLVEEAIRGDAQSLRELWHGHRRWVAAVLLSAKPRDVDLDDLLQDVAAQVVAKIGGLREPGAFKPWLRAVALNVAKTSGRKRSVRVAAVLRLMGDRAAARGQEEGEPEAGRAYSLREEGRRLMDMAGDLPDGYREPLLMRCVQGMGYREIGQVMGLPETTIETRIARGRRMLREMAEKAEAARSAASAERSGVEIGGREVRNG